MRRDPLELQQLASLQRETTPETRFVKPCAAVNCAYELRATKVGS